MKFLRNIVNTSYECTVVNPDRSPFFVYCKLVEEVCELSDVYHGIAASEPLNGEIADVIISAVDLLYVCDYKDAQIHGNMTKDEIIDSIITQMALAQGYSDSRQYSLEDYRFCDTTTGSEKNLAMIHHMKGRITRLLNQPQRSVDNLNFLVSTLIRYTVQLALSYGCAPQYGTDEGRTYYHCEEPSSVKIKVEHAIDHKIEKWRGKFGL